MSLAAHAAVLALALLVPVLKPTELPSPIPSVVRWPPPVRAAETAAGERAVRPVPRPSPAARDKPLPTVDLPPAGPPPSLSEPDSLPAPGDATTPCVTGCDPLGPPLGGGDGSPGEGAIDTGGAGAPGLGTARRPGGDIKPPVRVAYVAPDYPALARAAGVGGIVVLDCTIDRDGHVVDVRVLSGHPLLNEAATSAVRQWRYRPTLLNGVAVPVLMTVTVRFVPRK